MATRMSRTPRARSLALVALALALTASIAACAPSATAPKPSESTATLAPPPTPAPTVSPSPTPQTEAQQKLPKFREVVASVWASDARAQGRAYIDALVAAGFEKGAMQVTNDQSTIGNAAESLQFSVLVAGECLVGQVGPATGDPVVMVGPELGSGSCLIGHTRPIDW